LGLWAGSASAGMALGPLIAGLLLEQFWWGSVFMINVPVVSAALLLTWWRVPRFAPPGGPAWDPWGSLLLLGGLTALVYAIKEVAHRPFSPTSLLLGLALCAVCVLMYLRSQRQRAHPMIDLALFRLPN
ncbi:MFS transporter, partial [Bradyrhizobium sp. NBAIM08]|uniref:MFS transporter n=1 Tax=Bradyrhizobium sp. NBAIM08 TaxID=2793815 RepID=UPI001CD59E0C